MKDIFIFHRSFYCGTTTRLGILQSGESEMYFIKAHTKLIHISTDNAYTYILLKKRSTRPDETEIFRVLAYLQHWQNLVHAKRKKNRKRYQINHSKI